MRVEIEVPCVIPDRVIPAECATFPYSECPTNPSQIRYGVETQGKWLTAGMILVKRRLVKRTLGRRKSGISIRPVVGVQVQRPLSAAFVSISTPRTTSPLFRLGTKSSHLDCGDGVAEKLSSHLPPIAAAETQKGTSSARREVGNYQDREVAAAYGAREGSVVLQNKQIRSHVQGPDRFKKQKHETHTTWLVCTGCRGRIIVVLLTLSVLKYVQYMYIQEGAASPS